MSGDELGSIMLGEALKSGATLMLGKEAGWLTLESRTKANRIVAPDLHDLYRALATTGGYYWGNV